MRREELSQKKRMDERGSSTPASRGSSQRTTGTPSMRNTRSASKANPWELVVKTPASKKKTVVEEEECVLVEEVTAIACSAPLLNECPQHQGPKGDTGVTPGPSGAVGEVTQVGLVWVRTPGVKTPLTHED